MDADKLQSQMVYLKGLLEMENWRFDTNIVRRIYSLMASLATAQDQELLIFINKQIRHFDLGFNLFFEAQTLALSIVFLYWRAIDLLPRCILMNFYGLLVLLISCY